MAPASDLPRLSERSSAVLDRYQRRRSSLNSRGVTLGRARLAMQADCCSRCGLCMTGCPYSLIYSASHTWDRLRCAGRVTYHGGLLATRVDETSTEVIVTASDLETGRQERFTADRVLVACGAIGTTRLMVGSLGLYDVPIDVQESAQFMLPFVSRKPTREPRHERDFTLNQFNMVVDLDGGHDVSQLHFYTYNDAFVDNLPSALRGKWAEGPRRFALKRLSVALGYLPSWASPTFRIVGKPADGPGALAEVELSAQAHHFRRNTFLRRVLQKVSASAPALDLWPVLPSLSISDPGKSYHWGSMFPHTNGSSDRLASDLLGRVGALRRVHVVDAAVLPTVPATTFTLSVMANSHRIASTLLKEAD
jgi:ferredoxin